jgi:uncharacterized protein (DUF58 family)
LIGKRACWFGRCGAFLAITHAAYSGVACERTTAVDAVFVLDLGQSMIYVQKGLASGARLAAFELSPEDRVAILGFSSEFKTFLPLGQHLQEFDTAFRDASSRPAGRRGTSRLFDALLGAMALFPVAKDTTRCPVVFAITNDEDRGSTHGGADVVRAAAAKGVVISFVLIRNPIPMVRARYPDVDAAAGRLREVAVPTGGNVVVRDFSNYILRQLVASAHGGCTP